MINRILTSKQKTHFTKFKSPIGTIGLIASADALIEIKLNIPKKVNQPPNFIENKILSQAKRELRQYFEGKLTAFKVPVYLQGTNFELAVWRRIMQIPYGFQLSYSELAKSIGYIDAARAVGRANSRNRLPIIIPCHRVIKLNGEIGGYSGGKAKKKWLIELEEKSNTKHSDLESYHP